MLTTFDGECDDAIRSIVDRLYDMVYHGRHRHTEILVADNRLQRMLVIFMADVIPTVRYTGINRHAIIIPYTGRDISGDYV